MIDIHSHILPGLDDGSPDMETSVKMARIAVSEGITGMIATPHFIEKDREIEKEKILESVANLNRELRERGVDLQIFPGQEVFLTPGVPELYEKGRLLALGGQDKYLLVELPIMSIPVYAADVIYSLILKGVRVIIAHPERNRDIARQPEKINEFIEIGALVQVNTLSLLGVFGSGAKGAATFFIKKGLTHFLATDCHTARARSPRARKALDMLNPGMAELLAVENPSRVLEGKDIEASGRGYRGRGRDISLWKKISLFLGGFKSFKEVKNEI